MNDVFLTTCSSTCSRAFLFVLSQKDGDTGYDDISSHDRREDTKAFLKTLKNSR